ncbi:MAG: arsenic resistance protein [Deferribacterales bacterium]|nr:arsenic resistance protein [Deferribacterales bacterium]
MWKILSKLNKNLVFSIPVAMVLGFIWGLTLPYQWLKSLIFIMTFVMIFPMMVTLKIKNIMNFADIKLQSVTQIVNFGVLPFVALLLGNIFFKEQPYFALGLFIASLLPTSGMTISWTAFAKGNVEAAVKMTFVGLTLGSVALPFYISVFMGQSVVFNIADIIKQIVYIIVIPMIVGQIIRRFILGKISEPQFKQQYMPKFSSVSTLGVLGIVFIAMALKAESLVSQPAHIVFIVVPVVIFYGINYGLSTVIGRFFMNKADAVAHVYGTVMRNLSISLAIALNSFGENGADAALVIAVAFIFQVQSAAWYIKVCEKVFTDKHN